MQREYVCVCAYAGFKSILKKQSSHQMIKEGISSRQEISRSTSSYITCCPVMFSYAIHNGTPSPCQMV